MRGPGFESTTDSSRPRSSPEAVDELALQMTKKMATRPMPWQGTKLPEDLDAEVVFAFLHSAEQDVIKKRAHYCAHPLFAKREAWTNQRKIFGDGEGRSGLSLDLGTLLIL